MASSLNHKMILLLLVNGYFFATMHATPTPLETVCSKTTNVNFCLNVFGSDPATRTASLPGLGHIAIVTAIDKALGTKAYINKRLFFSSDPKLKDVLTQCAHAYDDALAALRIALVDLEKARYVDLYQHAHEGDGGASVCQQAFISASLPSFLTKDNLQLSDYCDIIQVIADTL